MRALPGTPVGGLFPPRLPPAIGEGQPHMAEQISLEIEQRSLYSERGTCPWDVLFAFVFPYLFWCCMLMRPRLPRQTNLCEPLIKSH